MGTAEHPVNCAIEGCAKSPAKRSRRCSMHNARIARHGDPHFKMRDNSARTRSSHGYIVIRRLGHPLTTPASRGLIFEHRAVLYNKIGPGSHPCHWCGIEVTWLARGDKTLTVDHVDSVKTNNAPENLVPSCLPCNSRRGSANRWAVAA